MLNYAYIVRCADGTLYSGWTNHLQRRIKAHNEGKAGAKYTRSRRPVQLVYFEGFETDLEAMRREWQIKQMTRKEKMDLIHGENGGPVTSLHDKFSHAKRGGKAPTGANLE